MKKIFLIILSVLSIFLVVALSITLVNAFNNTDFGSDSSVETNEGSNTIEEGTGSINNGNSNVDTSKNVKITVNYNQVSQDGEAYISNLYHQVDYVFSKGESYEIIHPDYSEQGYYINGEGRSTGVANNDLIINVNYFNCVSNYNLSIDDYGVHCAYIWFEDLVWPDTLNPISITNDTSEPCSYFYIQVEAYKPGTVWATYIVDDFVLSPGESVALWRSSGSFSGYESEKNYMSYITPYDYADFCKPLKQLPRG